MIRQKQITPVLHILTLTACWAVCGSAHAVHPVSVTRTYFYVSREQATAEIQVFLEDLFLFHDLRPNDQDFLEPDVIGRGIKLHKQFIAERFTVGDVAGETVACGEVGLQQVDLPDEGVPLAELMAHTLTFELKYEFPSPPEFLTFSQRFTDDEAVLPSEMKLAVMQENASEPHTAELRPGDVEIVRLSWTLPPLSAEASEEARERWAAKQKEETLGITSYSSVYSFLYIEDYEVRHEILIPLLTLEQSVLIARDEDEFLDIAEQDAARQQIEAYFCSGNPIEVDGIEVQPVVERCDFYGLDFRDFARQAPRKRVPMVSARVGVILSYATAGAPRSVTLTWNRFNSFVWAVDTVVFAYEKMSKTTLTRLGKKNTFEWIGTQRPAPPPLDQVDAVFPRRTTRYIPLVSLISLILIPAVVLALKRTGASLGHRFLAFAVLIMAATIAWPFWRWDFSDPFAPPLTISDRKAEAVFASLHKNIYRAVDLHEENAIYDALAKSIHGDLLRDVYVQMRQGLEMQEQGGAVARVRDVSIVSGDKGPMSPDENGQDHDERGFTYRCRWNVAGTVEHWGHIHERTNQYEAIFSVEPVDNAWKVTNIQLLDEQRLDFKTRLRGL